MEPFPEKPIDKWPLLVPSQRRMEACLEVRHTNSSRSRNCINRESPETAEIVTVEKLQKSYAML